MAETHLEQHTLRELFTEIERKIHDLTEHFERGFVPKVQALRSILKKGQNDLQSLQDITVRNHSDEVLKSYRFGKELDEVVESHLTAIFQAVEQIVEGEGLQP